MISQKKFESSVDRVLARLQGLDAQVLKQRLDAHRNGDIAIALRNSGMFASSDEHTVFTLSFMTSNASPQVFQRFRWRKPSSALGTQGCQPSSPAVNHFCQAV